MNAAPADYRVELEVYNGPLDLLLYLIRREEVDICDIPIARITGQYIAYVELLRRLEPDLVGDFLVMAANLMEIKSRTLLPHPPAVEEEEDLSDPRMELVRQLLEYKKFKDAARSLGVGAELAALKFPRWPVVPPSDTREIDLEDVQLWDLVEAFRKLLEAIGQRQVTHDILYDDTPIALHAADVLDALERAGGVQLFETVFEGRTKSQLIGLFLALLELLRQKRIRAYQEVPFGPISLQLLDPTPIAVDEERDYAYHKPDAEPAFEIGPDTEAEAASPYDSAGGADLPGDDESFAATEDDPDLLP
ncbi:MAG: segregation/condensation protein A [Planctomycetota bacterium]